MFNAAEVNELAARKQLLAAESNLNRQALKHEFAELRASAARVGDAVRFGRSAYPIVMAAAPLAGYVLASKAGAVSKIFRSAVWSWQVVRRLKPFWDKWKRGKLSRQDPPDAEILD